MLAALAVAAFAVAGCGGSSGSDDSKDASAQKPGCTAKVETVQSGYLSVASYPYPPYADAEGDKLTGAEGEILTKIADKLCLKIRVVRGTAASMIPDIQTGRADTTLGDWYRTAERAKVVRLGAPEFKDINAIVSKSGIKNYQDLKGKTVGSVLGFLWVSDLQKLVGSSNVKLYQTEQAVYADLAAGRIDALVDTLAAAKQQLKQTAVAGATVEIPPNDPSAGSSLLPGQGQFPVNLKNEELGKAMDKALEELRQSGDVRKALVKNGFPAGAAEPGPPTLLGG
ncbi:MAG TPA: transporter substrate-binding domain-containing protein [Thermoleophilaceae bacterium]|nr:transporter substrate-binding domain-containing protein [Thermoleophilaceae bacterium]